jgi:HEAT repeat protein
MGDYVFVSYKHGDHDFSAMLIRQLQGAGFNVWVDSEQLRAGENWREAINEAIKESFALVLVITPESKASEYVTYEWAFAQGAGIKVVPLLRKPTKMHPQLEILQYLDFTDLTNLPWDRLVRRLRELRGENPPNSVVVARDAPASVKSAVVAMDSHNPDDRRAALRSLAQMNHPAAHAALIGAVQHPMRDVRVDAAFMLAKLTNNQDAAAVPGLLDALTDEDPRIRIAACKVLGDIGDPASVPALLQILVRQSESDVHWQATSALSKIGAAAVPGLMDALKDDDWKVRRSAADALWGMREPSAVPGLVEALVDRNDVVKQASAGALEALGDAAVPGLKEALGSRNPALAQAATEVLQRIGTPAAMEATKPAPAASKPNTTGLLNRLPPRGS